MSGRYFMAAIPSLKWSLANSEGESIVRAPACVSRDQSLTSSRATQDGDTSPRRNLFRINEAQCLILKTVRLRILVQRGSSFAFPPCNLPVLQWSQEPD